MNDALEIISGDVLVDAGRIVEIGNLSARQASRTINAGGGYLLPGFIQTHVHLCQTLFRGYADDLALMEWLKTRIWPMEAAHTPASLAAATRLAASELLLGGTTTVLTMETVHDTEAVFEALEPMGLRAVVGKCMMDADAAVPARLLEQTSASIDESLAIASRWHGRANGRLRAAFAPRFAVSCTRELLEAVGSLSTERQLLVHTHASENKDEIALVRSRTGRANVAYLDEVGLASSSLCLAHCVWVDESEQELIASRQVKVLHCPGIEPRSSRQESLQSLKCGSAEFQSRWELTAPRVTTSSTCLRRCGLPAASRQSLSARARSAQPISANGHTRRGSCPRTRRSTRIDRSR